MVFPSCVVFLIVCLRLLNLLFTMLNLCSCALLSKHVQRASTVMLL